MARIPRIILITTQSDRLPAHIKDCADIVECFQISDRGTTISLTHTILGEGEHSREHVYSSQGYAFIELEIMMAMRALTGDGLIVYHHEPSLFDFARSLLLKAGLPYAIWFTNHSKLSWAQQHFASSARLRFSDNANIRARFRRAHVLDCELIETSQDAQSLVHSARRQRVEPTVSDWDVSQDGSSTLLVSYYMPPAETVAVHRLSYWKQALPEIAKDRGNAMSVSVLTAIESYQNDDRYIVIPDYGDMTQITRETQNLRERAQAARVNYLSIEWADRIRNYFDAHPDVRFDSVVISGNPFFYFTLGRYFLDKWDARIVLDFRDPFANNPRFTYSDDHKSFVTELEREFTDASDYSASVNQYCLDSLVIEDSEKGVVIANGYDERVIDRIDPIPLRSSDDKVNFVYTGSFYADRNAEPFLASMDVYSQRLIHIGRSAAADEHLDKYSALERYGLMPYEDVVGYCFSMDAGLIFTSGMAFEQTTKIFDYLATGIDIIIVTDGEPHTGELENITSGLGGIYWVRNTEEELTAFLETYRPPTKKRAAATQYSRRRQTEKLYDLLTKTR